MCGNQIGLIYMYDNVHDLAHMHKQENRPLIGLNLRHNCQHIKQIRHTFKLT